MVILFVWCTQDEIDHSHSMTYQVFPTLSDWISSFLKNNSDMTASNIGNNMLVKQVRYHMYMICIRYNRYMLYYIEVLFWFLILDTCMYFKLNFYVNVVKTIYQHCFLLRGSNFCLFTALFDVMVEVITACLLLKGGNYCMSLAKWR